MLIGETVSLEFIVDPEHALLQPGESVFQQFPLGSASSRSFYSVTMTADASGIQFTPYVESDGVLSILAKNESNWPVSAPSTIDVLILSV